VWGTRVVTVRGAPAWRFGPLPFVVAAGATAVCTVGAVVMGANTLATYAEFRGLTQGDARAPMLAARGEGQRFATNVLVGAAVVGAVVTVVLFTRTDFAPRAPDVDVALAPRPEGGAEGAVRVRF
jgi:hypothetical protein